MVLTHKYILLILVFAFAGPVAAAEFEIDSLPEKLAVTTKDFLEADTAKARAGMTVFSDEDLQKITNSFKKAHGAADQRVFWLAEELYRRNAERVAAERIRYLYYAVLAALAIIAAFTALTYARARKQNAPAPSPTPLNELPPVITQTRAKPKARKKAVK